MLKQTSVLLLIFIFSGGVEAGVIGVQTHFEANEKFHDVVGVRYKLRLDENLVESTGKIIFNASRFYNPDNDLHGYYAAIETSFYNFLSKLPDHYVDLGCVTSGGHGRPAGVVAIDGFGSIVAGIVDWWRDYPDLHGRVGLKSTGQTVFPTFSMTVDSIDGLNKSSAESQVDMTGKDVQLELVRGENFTSPLSGWGAHWMIGSAHGDQYCEDDLQPNTLYRKWHLTLTIDGVAYRFEVAVFEDAGRYLLPQGVVSMRTEFFEFDGYFRAYYWDFEVLRERGGQWTPIKTLEMTEHVFNPSPNRDYGPKFAIHDGQYVLEISNDHTGSVDEGGTYFQKGDIFTFPDPSEIDVLPTINWNRSVASANENQGVANIVANLDMSAPSEIKVAVRRSEAGMPVAHDLLKIPAGELTGTLAYPLGDDAVKQPDRRIEFIFDSSCTARFSPQYRMVLTVIDDDPINDIPTAPIITAVPGLSCTTLSPRWVSATDSSGPIVSYNVYRKSTNSEYELTRQVSGGENKAVDRVPAPGSYTYVVSAVDVFGVEGKKSQPITSSTPACSNDPVPPTGNILAPSEGSVIGGLVVVDVEAFDNAALGANSVDLYRDDNIYIDTIFLNLNQLFLLDTMTLAEGPHLLFIRIHDFGGNVYQPAPVNVIVNHSIPTIPTGLSLQSINSDTIELQWDSAPLPEVGLVSHYKVLRDGNLIGTSIQAHYSDSGNIPGKVHCYALAAVSYTGVSSGLSHGVCADSFQIVGDLDGDGDIDVDDMAMILAARNTSANETDDPRDLDEDGRITVLDARKLVLLCTRPRCAVE